MSDQINEFNDTKEEAEEISAETIVVESEPAEETFRQPEPVKTKEKKETSLSKKIIALVLCCSLLSAIVGAGGAIAVTKASAKGASSEETKETSIFISDRQTEALNTVKVRGGEEMTAAEVYAANVNSTVGITTEITTNYWGYTSSSAASGSGFIVTEDGYILTNYHVIEDASSVKVALYDGTSYDAKIIGYDESNDIAVLKIEAEGLTPVVIGDSDAMNVGDPVVAIGNPLGELTFSLTAGAVSALDREITLSSSTTMTLIQTDTAINSGNSGGALFNMYGEVIGITNAKYSSSGSSSSASIDNIGFAIPINSVMGLVQQLIENGYITYPYIGVSVTTVSSESQTYGIPAGAAVAAVTDGAPASQGGIQVNDIITAFDGVEVKTSSALVDLVGKTKPGEQHTFTVYRQGETLELTVTIGERSGEVQTQTTSATQQYSSQGSSGFPGGSQGFGGGYPSSPFGGSY